MDPVVHRAAEERSPLWAVAGTLVAAAALVAGVAAYGSGSFGTPRADTVAGGGAASLATPGRTPDASVLVVVRTAGDALVPTACPAAAAALAAGDGEALVDEARSCGATTTNPGDRHEAVPVIVSVDRAALPPDGDPVALARDYLGTVDALHASAPEILVITTTLPEGPTPAGAATAATGGGAPSPSAAAGAWTTRERDAFNTIVREQADAPVLDLARITHGDGPDGGPGDERQVHEQLARIVAPSARPTP